MLRSLPCVAKETSFSRCTFFIYCWFKCNTPPEALILSAYKYFRWNKTSIQEDLTENMRDFTFDLSMCAEMFVKQQFVIKDHGSLVRIMDGDHRSGYKRS